MNAIGDEDGAGVLRVYLSDPPLRPGSLDVSAAETGGGRAKGVPRVSGQATATCTRHGLTNQRKLTTPRRFGPESRPRSLAWDQDGGFAEAPINQVYS